MPTPYFLGNELLDHIMGKGDYPSPSPLYLGIFSTSISVMGLGTEIIGNGYLRIETSASDWSFADLGQIRNTSTFTFGPATADWGKIYALGLIGPGNNVLMWNKITKAPYHVFSAQTLVYEPNEVVLSIT